MFYSTNDVFASEERLNSKKIKCRIVPTPVQDKAYCGVCLETFEKVEELLGDVEYEIII